MYSGGVAMAMGLPVKTREGASLQRQNLAFARNQLAKALPGIVSERNIGDIDDALLFPPFDQMLGLSWAERQPHELPGSRPLTNEERGALKADTESVFMVFGTGWTVRLAVGWGDALGICQLVMGWLDEDTQSWKTADRVLAEHCLLDSKWVVDRNGAPAIASMLMQDGSVMHVTRALAAQPG
jgi:hypothetical protein